MSAGFVDPGGQWNVLFGETQRHKPSQGRIPHLVSCGFRLRNAENTALQAMFADQVVVELDHHSQRTLSVTRFEVCADSTGRVYDVCFQDGERKHSVTGSC
jgi:hypothetical protein